MRRLRNRLRVKLRLLRATLIFMMALMLAVTFAAGLVICGVVAFVVGRSLLGTLLLTAAILLVIGTITVAESPNRWIHWLKNFSKRQRQENL